MSATAPIHVDHLLLTELTEPRVTPGPQREGQPTLRPVAEPASKPKRSPVLGAIIAVGVILGIFAAQLALSILVSEGAYETRSLEIEKRDLARVERVLVQNLDKLASPQNLADNAAALGMVQNIHPATLRMSDGVIQGSLDSATRPPTSNLVPNAQLETLPVLDAEGLMSSRNQSKAPALDASAAIRWQGKLPAPATH